MENINYEYGIYTEFDYTDVDYFDEGLCHKEEVFKVGPILVPVFLSIVVLLSLIGNILVLKSFTNVFILNLTRSDLLFTVGLPFWAYYFIWGWTLGDAACKAVRFVFYAGFYSSILFLMLMTVQRYVAVVYPLSDWEKKQGFSLIPIIAWLVSIAAALPAPFYSSVMPDPADPSRLYCEYNSISAVLAITYEQNSFFICTFVVMGFCCIKMLQTIFKTRTKKRHHTIRLILCIIVVFFLTWAPYNLVVFLHTLIHHQFFTDCKVSHHLDYAAYVSKLLAFSHCCQNPIFYIFISVKFRNHLKGILRIFQSRRNADVQQTRTGTVLSHGSMCSNGTNSRGNFTTV